MKIPNEEIKKANKWLKGRSFDKNDIGLLIAEYSYRRTKELYMQIKIYESLLSMYNNEPPLLRASDIKDNTELLQVQQEFIDKVRDPLIRIFNKHR